MNILQIIVITLSLILFLAFIFYRKVIYITSVLIALIFFVSLISVFAAVFVPQTFQTIAEVAVKDTPFAVQLKNFDTTITNVSNLPANVLDSLGNIFNPTSSNSQTKVSSDLYNQFITFIAAVLRIITLLVGIILMVISVYVRYAYAGVMESEKLHHKVRELEKEVENLKVNR